MICIFILASPRKLLRFFLQAFHAHNFVADGQFIAFFSTLLARRPRNVDLDFKWAIIVSSFNVPEKQRSLKPKFNGRQAPF